MSSDALFEPLPREEVTKAVERRYPSRIPLVRARWWGEGLWNQHGERLNELGKYPEDTVTLWANPLDIGRMGLSWKAQRSGRGHDSNCIIDDWAHLDEFIEKMPDPEEDPQYDGLIEQAAKLKASGRYILFGWWALFFERPWGIRGMENLMLDYHLEPENIHRLHDALCEQYCRHLRRAARDLGPDGFWTSDDLGHQTQLMMSPPVYREFLLPYYQRVGDCLRELGMHWWLHSCGNNTEILGDLADAGVDVFHPVQKHTMDEQSVSDIYGDRMTFLAGIDVQHILPEDDPAGVRREVRYLIDTFDREGGGMCLGAGNGIVGGTPFENIEAFLHEAIVYGAEHRGRFAR
ncbi:methylcobamide--CoM methyltransferase [Candidatus Poribacteria bacterium]|nr:methylcobamide--CoM methyltransferase [Candidatus Poribacteria bacterium]